MKVEVLTLTEEGLEERDFSDALIIKVDGEKIFKFFDGEPEDNTLSRNFNDVFNIVAVIKKAYEAGKEGEELVVESKEVNDVFNY